MKSGSLRSGWQGLATFMCRCSFLFQVALLVVGYVFLSPDNCEAGIRYIGTKSWVLAGSDLDGWVIFARKVIPSLILYWAVVFVVGLFVSLPIRRFWLFVIWVLMGFAIWLAPCKLENYSRYYDAFYASFALVLGAGWLASWLYGFSRSGGAKALALVLFVVAGSLLYEWLASLKAVQFHEGRWLRPEQIVDCIFGVLDKQKDIADTAQLPSEIAFGLYYIFHALLAFFGGYVIIGFVSKAAVNTILLRFSRRPDNIFWGVSSEAKALARSLRSEKHEKCIFVIADLSSADAGMLDGLSDDGFLWVPEGRGTLRMVARRVKKHFFLSPFGSRNVEWASRLATFAEGEPEVYVSIDDEADDSWLFRWADRDDIRKRLNVHIVRETSLAADILLRDHPMLLSPGVTCKEGKVVSDSPDGCFAFKLLQIGFGSQGRMLLNRMICDSQAPGAKFSAVIVDKNQVAFDGYEVRCPDVKSTYGLDFKNLDVQTKDFFDWLEGEISKASYTRIVVTTGNDDVNLSVANFIVRHYREAGDISRLKVLPNVLFVRVRHPENYADFPLLGNGKSLDFTPFGADREVYSYQSIVNLDIDHVARQMNARWAGGKDVYAAWRNASFFDRESSRASAMGVKNLWRLATGDDDISSVESVRAKWDCVMEGNRNVQNNLADAEHLRWMAFHYVRGIRTWDPENDLNVLESVKAQMGPGLKAKQIKANQRILANRHAALIPTEKLFRMDVFLDILSFEQLSSYSKLFKLYADELHVQWELSVAKCKGCPSEKDFSDNAKLLALNHCVFALWDASKYVECIKVLHADIQTQLREFSENVIVAYGHKDAETKLLATVSNFAKRLDMFADGVGILRKVWSRQTRRELMGLRRLSKDLAAYTNLDAPHPNLFYTIGKMVGNDDEVVYGVPYYIMRFQDSLRK